MLSRNYLPAVVKCEATGIKDQLDMTANRSEDGTTLVLKVVNMGDKEVATKLQISGFTVDNSFAQVTELSGPLDAVNSANQPKAIVPKQSQWQSAMEEGKTSYTFRAHSFTIIRWQGQAMK